MFQRTVGTQSTLFENEEENNKIEKSETQLFQESINLLNFETAKIISDRENLNKTIEQSNSELDFNETMKSFQSGDDDDIFHFAFEAIENKSNENSTQVRENSHETIEKKPNEHVHKSSSSEIFTFQNNEDESLFNASITERFNRARDVSQLRYRCKMQAFHFNFDLLKFNRIPIWVFRYFAADDPLCQESDTCLKIEIMTVFMLINKISPDLIMAFYLEGGQNVLDCLKLNHVFHNLKKLFEKTDENYLIPYFGSQFSFHIESKTLRRIDMSIVQFSSTSNNEPFIPQGTSWRRNRIIRNLIRNGQFTVQDKSDLCDIKEAWKNGLKCVGHNNKKKMDRRF